MRLRIGDLYAKTGDKAKSVEAYTQVAEHLGSKGFEAKAVAIYKQILRIDPDQAEIRVQLGELYQRLGLTSDALREFQAATKRYQERGARKKAFELLRRVASLDPGNIPNRLRLTELLHREEYKDEALEEYQSLVRDVGSSGRSEDVIRVAEHMFERFPDDVDALRAYAKAKIDARSALDAVEPIRKSFAQNHENIPLREMLVEVYEAAGDLRAAQAVYKEIADLYKTRGDEEKARDILQRYVPANPLGGEGDDPEPDSDPGIVLTEEVTDSDPRGTSVPTIEPEGDLEIEPSAASGADDLLAEAKVALQFGDLKEAKTRARETLDQEPLSDGARAVLAEVAARQNDLPGAIRLSEERRDLAAGKADGDLISEIEAQIRTYQGNLSSPPQTQPETLDELPDVEIMLEDDEDQDETAASVEPPPELRQSVPNFLQVEEDVEMEVEPFTSGTFSSLQEQTPPPPDFSIEGIEIDESDDGKMQIQEGASQRDIDPFDSGDVPSDAAIEVQVVTEEPDEATGEPTGVEEELEEAEFYVEQGMLAEGERVLRSVLEREPDHAHARLRLGEIAAARGQAPGARTPRTPRPSAPPAIDVPSVDAPGAEPEVEAMAVGEEGEDVAEFSLDFDDEELAIPPEPAKPTPRAPAPKPAARGTPRDPAVASGPEELVGDLDDLLSGPSDDNPFDLAAELEQAVSEVVPGAEESSPDMTLGGVAPELEDLFNSFKRGIKEQLGEGESEAHYDLGIAYREMGLIEDAIREFEVASRGEEQRLGALALLAGCKIDAGRPKEAIADLKKALELVGKDKHARQGLQYELARALEACGEKDRALKTYRLVKKQDPDFRDVIERIEELERS